MPRLTPIIDQLIDQLLEESYLIPESRLEILNQFAAFIRKNMSGKSTKNLVYICTHNSRRSQIAQIWSHTASHAFQIPNCRSFSGGTEVTGFNSSAVHAMKTLGFQIQSETEGSENPHFQVNIGDGIPPLTCYSKKYEDAISELTDFASIMTCSDADTNCPFIPGSSIRIPFTFDDPKQFDGTDNEQKEYLKTAIAIGREILYVFNKAL